MTVTVAKLPLPTARIRVRVFQDNAPLNGMWDTDEAGLQNFQVTIDDAGGTYGMSGGPQSTDAFGNKIGTTYEPCPDAERQPGSRHVRLVPGRHASATGSSSPTPTATR